MVQAQKQGGKRKIRGAAADVQKVKTDPRVDRLFRVEKEYKDAEKAFKSKWGGIATEVKDLKDDLKEDAREAGVTQLIGDVAVFECKPRTTTSVVFPKFIGFLRNLERIGELRDFCKIGLGDAKAAFGEAVLKENGCLDSETDDYGTVKCFEKPHQV